MFPNLLCFCFQCSEVLFPPKKDCRFYVKSVSLGISFSLENPSIFLPPGKGWCAKSMTGSWFDGYKTRPNLKGLGCSGFSGTMNQRFAKQHIHYNWVVFVYPARFPMWDKIFLWITNLCENRGQTLLSLLGHCKLKNDSQPKFLTRNSVVTGGREF